MQIGREMVVHGRENSTSPYTASFASCARKMQSLRTPVVSPPATAPREPRRSPARAATNTHRLGVQGAPFREQGKGTGAKEFVHGRENGTSPYTAPFACCAGTMQSLRTPVVSPPQKRRVRHVGGQRGEPQTRAERARNGLFTGAKTASHLTRRLHLVVLAQCRASTLLWFPPRKSAA